MVQIDVYILDKYYSSQRRQGELSSLEIHLNNIKE